MINDRHNENATSTMGYNIWQHSWYGVSTYIYIYIYTKHGHTQYLEKMVKDYCHLLHLAESDKVEKTTSYLKIATPN